MKTQIFLPGIDPETGAYASSMLGSATVLSRTEVDAPGTSNDAERVSESRRDLRQAPELRRMVKYKQGIAIIDTADPILFRFPARADTGDVAVAPRRSLLEPPTLADAVGEMDQIKEAAKRIAATPPANNADSAADTRTGQQTQKDKPLVSTGEQPSQASPTEQRPLRLGQFDEVLDQNVLPFEPPDEEEDESCAA